MTQFGLKQHQITSVGKALEFIAKHFQEPISLKEISAHAHISPFHLSRLFKKITDRTPHQHLIMTRLDHAGLLLRTTSLPVTDICYASGFSSLEHFATIFKSRYRTTPTGYRKNAIIMSSPFVERSMTGSIENGTPFEPVCLL